jgi:RNA polymerase sigma-70 factor, ECF subfamily
VDFEKLVNEHKDGVYRQMIRVCRNREDAEDVLIEALMRAYRQLEQLRADTSFRAWLLQIAKRVCWNLKDRQALMPLLQLSELEEQGRSFPSAELAPDEVARRSEWKALLAEAVEALPAEYGEVYRLRDVEGMSGEAVAKRLGISLAAMKSRLNRARAELRSRLDSTLK